MAATFIKINVTFEPKTIDPKVTDTSISNLIKDIRECVKRCKLSEELTQVCGGETSLVASAQPLNATLSSTQDKTTNAGTKILSIPIQSSCNNISTVDLVHGWVKAVIRTITQTVKGETDTFKVISLQCDASDLLSAGESCGTPCGAKTVRLVGKDSYADIWTEINKLLDRTKDSVLLYLRLTWPTTCPDLTDQCQKYTEKTSADETVFMQGQSSNYLSLKAPLLFMTMNRIKSVKHMLHLRVQKRCRAYLHKQTASRWRQSFVPATRLRGFPNLTRQTIPVSNGTNFSNKKTAWFKKQKVGELKAICRVLIHGEALGNQAVTFRKNGTAMTTNDDDAFVETLFEPANRIEAFVAP
jgi:hypothetical protein